MRAPGLAPTGKVIRKQWPSLVTRGFEIKGLKTLPGHKGPCGTMREPRPRKGQIIFNGKREES